MNRQANHDRTRVQRRSIQCARVHVDEGDVHDTQLEAMEECLVVASVGVARMQLAAPPWASLKEGNALNPVSRNSSIAERDARVSKPSGREGFLSEARNVQNAWVTIQLHQLWDSLEIVA